MSRVGKLPIEIPSGVEVALEGSAVTVSGPKGKLAQSFSDLAKISLADNEVRVRRGRVMG